MCILLDPLLHQILIFYPFVVFGFVCNSQRYFEKKKPISQEKLISIISLNYKIVKSSMQKKKTKEINAYTCMPG